jgi:hypothetical protein
MLCYGVPFRKVMEYINIRGKIVINNKSCASNVAVGCQFVRPLSVVDVSPAAGGAPLRLVYLTTYPLVSLFFEQCVGQR